MQNINMYIKENIGSVSSNVFTAPNIPEKKLNNAAKSMGLVDVINSIVAIFDNTAFGSAKDGFAITGEKIAIKDMFEDPYYIKFSDLKAVEYIKDVEQKSNGKEKITESIKFVKADNSSVNLTSLLSCNYELLANILNDAIKNTDSFEEEDQLITLSEMSERLKIAYLKIVINMAFSDDGVVDDQEFAEILLLMTRLELTTESRFEVRGYISNTDTHLSVAQLLNVIDEEASPSHIKSIRISLVKDLISTYMSVNNGKYENFDFLNNNKKLFAVSDEEIDLAVDAIKLDFNMLKTDFTDDALTKSMKELSAKAGAVGVPLAAVYLSGSVIGMSAAGLTSGLATLGLGGALGFSSMATGIGIAVLIGVGAYKGIKHLTGANELDQFKRRELMLNEVIKQTQSTISLLIGDLNFITNKLNEALKNHSLQDAKIQKLMKMMTALSGAADVLNEKSNRTQNNCIKMRCPNELDHGKLKSLTKEPTKQQIYTVVMSFYIEKDVSKVVDGNEKISKVYSLKNDIPTSQLDKLAKIFENIGYFNAVDVIKGKVSGLFS